MLQKLDYRRSEQTARAELSAESMGGTTGMSALVLDDIAKAYGQTSVIAGLNLKVDAGEFIVCVGPSGCGKSTLLRLIAGLESVSDGKITLGQREVTTLPPAERSIAMVFQNYALYPHMTVAENIGFGLRLAGVDKATRRAKVEEVAKILRLDALLDRKPKALSGGQRQRVAIGRAIVKRPSLFLFDEPLSNLDAELRTQMRVELAKLHRTMNATMIYVTHDQTEAMTLADRIVVLRAGKIEQIGKPSQLYADPQNTFVAGFIGSPKINLLDIKQGLCLGLGDHAFQAALIPGTATVAVRPEHVAHAPLGLAFSGVVEIAERLGHVAYLYVRAAGGALITILERGPHAFGVGETITFDLPPEHLLLFGDDGQRLRWARAA
jgi:ABC-type sugar transport system ATPase subunit